MATVIFMGTPDFSVPILQRLIDTHTVLGVVTQPDRPAGRKQQIKQSPIKQLAIQHGLPVYQPEKLRKRPDAIQHLRDMGHPDIYVVAAFGQILPQEVLDIPVYGSINVHASLLPRWRGAAPIHAAIRAGDSETGVTIMKMDAGLDTGPMILKRAIPIAEDETGQSLHDKLAVLGADLLIEALPRYLGGELIPEAQNDELATFSPQIQKAEGEIDWSQPAIQIERLVRAFTPWPGTHTQWNGKRLKVLHGHLGAGHAPVGKVITLHDGRVAIGTGDGVYCPTRLQLAGGKPLSISDFANGYSDFVGCQLG